MTMMAMTLVSGWPTTRRPPVSNHLIIRDRAWWADPVSPVTRTHSCSYAPDNCMAMSGIPENVPGKRSHPDDFFPAKQIWRQKEPSTARDAARLCHVFTTSCGQWGTYNTDPVAIWPIVACSHLCSRLSACCSCPLNPRSRCRAALGCCGTKTTLIAVRMEYEG
jgi:hypothetical protein